MTLFEATRLRKNALHRVRQDFTEAYARRSILHFCAYVYPKFIIAPHHVKMAQALDAVTEGRITRVQMSLPPRHTKSLMCSILYPAYRLGRFPDKTIIHASYASSLSNKFSLEVRDILKNNQAYHHLFPHVALHPDRQRLDDWLTTEGGGLRSIGVQGGITGAGADCFIIDDPHKEGDELSPTTLEAVYTWYASAAVTRLSPGAPVIMPLTRWHPNDLPGRLLALANADPNADQWTTLIFPALANAHDPLGRKPGQALWPERYNRKALLAIRAISARYFEALYQQNPQFHNEPLFTNASFRRGEKESAAYFWTFDLAITITERSDYTVAGRWSFENDILCLHKIHRIRAQWPDVKKLLKQIITKYPKDTFYFPTHTLELIAAQTLTSDFPDAKILPVEQPGDKHARACVLSDFAKNGTVLIIPTATADEFINEHTGFPDLSKHNDCVDMSSVATHAIGLQERFKLAIIGLDHAQNQNPDTFEKLGF